MKERGERKKRGDKEERGDRKERGDREERGEVTVGIEGNIYSKPKSK